MKKLSVLFISAIIISIILSSMAFTENKEIDNDIPNKVLSDKNLKLGEYFTLGKYNEEQIVWRYMADNENGKLIVSDKILCIKPFGIDNFWNDSFIRKWLNSTMNENEFNWSNYIPNWIIPDINVHEKGFLNKNNFTLLEKSVIKITAQWTMLPEECLEFKENSVDKIYSAVEGKIPGSPRDGGKIIYYDINKLPTIYNGAAHLTTDQVFLLDEMQVYNIYNRFNDVKSLCNLGCYAYEKKYYNEYYGYFLRTPSSGNVTCIDKYGKYSTGLTLSGIRPAFYLDENNAVILSGSGTAEEPYIMTGREIEVYTNGTKAEMSDQPTIKDGIVMLPVKETFEKLGAKVNWDEETQAVTIEKDGNYIYMLKDNKGIMINGEIYDLGYPMTMIDDVAYVPLTAIEMTITPNVTWNGEQYRIDINK